MLLPRTRSIIKSLVYRLFTVAMTTSFVFLATGSLAVAASISFVEFLYKLIVYYIYERIWDRLFKKGCVVWLTGLSGSGKSTIVKELEAILVSNGLVPAVFDGDEVRAIISGLGFSRQDRAEQSKRLSWLAAKYAKSGGIAIVSVISPYADDRFKARSLTESTGNRFVEVFIDTSLSICESRDPKGLYKKARAGEIKNFTGIDDVYETPIKPDIRIDTKNLTPRECADSIMRIL